MSALRQRARQWGVSIAALILPEAVDSLLRESTSDEVACSLAQSGATGRNPRTWPRTTISSSMRRTARDDFQAQGFTVVP
jgi:hypothetical protein